MAMATSKLNQPRVVPPAQWLTARIELLKKEKQLTHLRDELNRQRMQLPWEKVEKNYIFESTTGKESLADLFGERSQLIVYHFMLGPDWKEGCPSCSMIGDHIDGSVPHLAARDVRLVAVSRAPYSQIADFKKRMGWKFHWASAYSNEFNRDYHVSVSKQEAEAGETYYNYAMIKFPSEERPGASVFYKDATGTVFHTYSVFGRGLELGLGVYNWLDIAPKGRNEEGLPWPMAWVRHHDKYDAKELVDTKGPAAKTDHNCCADETRV